MVNGSGHGRVRRALGMMASIVGVTLTFVVAIVSAVVLHLDRPLVRRWVAIRANAILRDTFMGEVRVEHIGALGLGGISGVRASVRDPEGVPVLFVDGVRVCVRPVAIARSALFGRGPIAIDVPCASVGHVDVNLDADAAGDLRIANVWTSKAPPTPKKNEPPGRGVLVDVPVVRLAHAWAHGTPAGAPLVDAELYDLAGHVRVDPALVRAELERVSLLSRALPQGADPRGSLTGSFAMPAANGQGMEITATFGGTAFGVPTTIEGRMIDRRVEAKLDVLDPNGMRSSLSEIAVGEPLSVHAEAHGDLPQVEATLAAALGNATVDGRAVLEATRTTRVAGELAVRQVDVAALSESAPHTSLGLDAKATLSMREDGIFGDVAIDTLPGVVDRTEVPRVEVRANLAGQVAHLLARVRDASMPTEVKVDVSPRPGVADGRLVLAAVRSRVPDLHRLPVVGAKLGGSAEVEAAARLRLPEQEIDDAAARVLVERVAAAQGKVGRLEARARAHGNASKAVVDAEVQARELAADTLALASIAAKAHVEREADAVTIREAHVEAARPALPAVSADVRFARVEGSAFRAEGVELRGIGDPVLADVSKNGSEIRGRIEAPRIDLARVAALAGQQRAQGVEHGTLEIHAAGGLRRGIAKAKVTARVDDLAMKTIQHASSALELSIDDRKIDLDWFANIGKAGQVAIRSQKVVIGGRVDDPAAWKRIAGKVHVTGDVDLARAMSLLPPDSLPVSDLRGRLTVQGRIGRDTPEAPPEIQFHAHTNGFGVATQSGAPERVDGVVVEKSSTVRSTDVDFGIDVRNDAPSGLTDVAFHATDRHGALVAFDAKAILPYVEILRDPASAKGRVLEAPLNARLVVPPRRLDQLPPVLGLSTARGEIAGDIDASGTALDPRIHLDVRARQAKLPSMPAEAKADGDMKLDYDGRVAEFSAKLGSGGKAMADVGARFEARLRDFIEARPNAEPAWNASAHARLASFPLETIPGVGDERVHGRVTGEVRLEGLHKDAVLKGHFDLEGLAVGGAEYSKGRIDVDTTGNKLVAAVRLDQKDGFVDASASTGLAWGAELAPKLDEQKPVIAKLSAHAFRASAIAPFIESAVPSLDGRIDANATAKLVPGKRGAELDGTVGFRDGTVLVAALGEELRGVKADVKLASDGTIRVTNVIAKGTEGTIRADATAKLDGLRLADATANIRISDKPPFALAVSGTPLGEIGGTIRVKAAQSQDAKSTNLVVEVPKLDVMLPQVLKSGVETLEDKDNIHVGVFRGRKRFVELPLAANEAEKEKAKNEPKAAGGKLAVDVRLGKITIERRNQLSVEATGNPKVEIEGGETKITGQVRVVRGWVDVQGKKFEIEKGTVTFNGESPPDPVVVATAGWTAADNSRIYADFVGPVKSGKVTLRSEPARPQNEILAMILFGTADGANPAPPQQNQTDGTAKTAVGLGGGYLAQGLTEALNDLGGIKATARVDTTESNNPRPEIEFQISPKISLGFAHVLGTPPITEPDKNQAKVDYRFHRNWSMETTFGDHGTSLVDAIWQKRY
jgi:translocation and assembly module TamB